MGAARAIERHVGQIIGGEGVAQAALRAGNAQHSVNAGIDLRPYVIS